jgi:diadenosine tetraphosphate (Ap4A) HIT family hydrolase
VAAEDCLFCRLAAGEGEASVLHEDARTVTLLDIQPVSPGHMLVIPRGHATHLADELDLAAQALREVWPA